MRDDDFWNREYRRHSIRGQSFWDDNAKAMELLMEGNQMMAREIADGLRRLWRGVRRQFVMVQHNTDRDRRLPHL